MTFARGPGLQLSPEGMFKIPEKYEEDDTPSRFKLLMNPPTKNTVKPSQRANTVDDEWTVRPGETFRQFNARIRGSGLSLPPGVPETTRVHQGYSHNEERSQEDAQERRPEMRFAASEGTRLPGERTKQKRKEFLKRKDEAKRRKNKNDNDHDACSLVNAQRKNFRDVVKKPPNLKVKPKATSRRGPS